MATPATDDKPLLSVRGLCKYFQVKSGGVFKRRQVEVKAVDEVSFDLRPGKTLGIVGESGSGKTTAIRAILRALTPTRGEALFDLGDRIVDLAKLTERELRPLRPEMQMIFQDPFSSLNPRMTVGDIVAEPLLIHNLAKGSERVDRVDAMLERVGLKPEHRQRYPHAFSGGQRQRIGIARALVMNPRLVVADEAVSALDVSVQAQVINLLKELQGSLGLTYIFVAHDLSVVKHLCDQVAVMYAGRIVEMGSARALFSEPKHPYTRALLASIPSPDPDRRMSFQAAGEAADPGALPSGCSFHPRCSECFDTCRIRAPELRTLDVGRSAACHLY